MTRTAVTAAGVATAVVLAVMTGVVFGVLLLTGSAAAACTSPAAVTSATGTVPAGRVAGYEGEQLVNAATIMRAGADLGLGARDQTIGVMTAMGESGLRVLDYGDAVGPDSRGLFQQRANGAWGSYADRMDPYTSAQNFFRVLSGIAGRDSLAPTIVAHRVQRNADPLHYERYWDAAVEVAEAVTGTDLGLAPGTGGAVCTGLAVTPGTVTAGGWAAPGTGPITSRYGMRTNPVTGIYKLHAGVDLGGGGCDGPIWAAHGGTVTFAGTWSDGTGVIAVDHGGGIVTRYLHMYPSGILVRVGDGVSAGQQIARVGSTGNSTGCHLHFEVQINGVPTDPEPFMAAVGAPLG